MPDSSTNTRKRQHSPCVTSPNNQQRVRPRRLTSEQDALLTRLLRACECHSTPWNGSSKTKGGKTSAKTKAKDKTGSVPRSKSRSVTSTPTKAVAASQDQDQGQELNASQLSQLGTPTALRSPNPAAKTNKSRLLATPRPHQIEPTLTAMTDQPRADDLMALSKLAKEVLLRDGSVIDIPPPVKVCGDVHGQVGDLAAMESIGGPVGSAGSKYLFLGDYVDRGTRGLEVFVTLLCRKIRDPDRVFLLRGNHECHIVTQMYGFHDECRRRYDQTIWKAITSIFDCLPIAAVIGEKIFCIHGGISPKLQNIQQIRDIQRPCGIKQDTLLSDLLWADPTNQPGWSASERGISLCYGPDVTQAFLDQHGFDFIVRAYVFSQNHV